MRFAVLGPLEASNGGKIAIDRPFQRRVLSVLLLHVGQSLGTERLIDRVWGDQPPTTARAALHTHISALRKRLGDGVILTDPNGYRIDTAAVSVDMDQFGELMIQAIALAEVGDWLSAIGAVESALRLWRGEPFVELADDPFALPTIVKLSEQHERFLELQVEALMGLSRTSEAIANLEALVREYPLRERLWELLMTGRVRLGRHAEALDAFREATGHLAEIGLEPGEALKKLEDRIHLRDPSLSAAKGNLPSDLSSFIGRHAEAGVVGEMLTNNRLVTLTGPGGSGKTRLALHVARDHLADFPDGVWLTEMADLRHQSQVATAISRTMRLQPKGDDALDVIASALANEQMLLMVDNAEHLLNPIARVVERLLRAAPDLRILVTSRERLRIRGESVFDVPGMARPNEISSIREAEAVALFIERASEAHHGFHVEQESLDAIVTICERLDGIPLAIELAAARTRSLSIDDLRDRLDDHLYILSDGDATAPKRQRTLQATIEWSYRLLDQTERALLNRLSVFRGVFTLDAAELVTSGAGIAPDSVATYLSRLIDKSLVTRHRDPEASGYRLLESVRQFAFDRFRETTHVTTIRNQHLRWAMSLVAGLWERALGGDHETLDRDLGACGDNLQEALDWAIESSEGRAATLLSAALGWHSYYGGHLTEATSILGKALLATSDRRSACLISALLARSLAYSEALDRALETARKAHRLVSHLTDPLEMIWVISTLNLALSMAVEVDPTEMMSLAEEAAPALGSGVAMVEALAHQVIADASSWNGDQELGLKHQRAAQMMARRAGTPMLINEIYGQSIYNYMLHPEARREEPSHVTQEWLSIQTLDDAAWNSTSTDWLPWVYMQVGDLVGAQAAVERIGARTMEGYNKAVFLMARASLDWMRGDLEAARASIAEMGTNGVSVRWAHTFYPQAAEIAADQRRVDDARGSAMAYQSTPVHPTGESAKLGALGPLLRAEVNAAIRNPDSSHLQAARQTLDQMSDILRVHPPLTGGATSLLTPQQNLTFARAELSRAGQFDPDLWEEAVTGADYVYYQLYGKFRLAEALLAVGRDRDGSELMRTVVGEAGQVGTRFIRSQALDIASQYQVSLG